MVPATSPDSESADLLESSGLLCSRYTYSCPFFLGIGNKDTDATAYYGSGIAITNIIIMQKTGEVVAGGFVPQPVDVLDHHYSRSAVLLSKYGEDDSEAAALLVESIAAASPLTMKLFSSYSDPRLHTFTKEIILASSKVLSFGGEPHEENEGMYTRQIEIFILAQI